MLDPELPPVGLLTYNRHRLLKISLKSLLSTRHGPIFVRDDGSSPETVNYLSSEPLLHLTVNPINLGPDRNTAILCDQLAAKTDCFILTNSDVVYSENCFRNIYNIYRKYKENRRVSLVSAFRTVPDREVMEMLGKDVLRVNKCTCVYLVDSQFWRFNRMQFADHLCDLSQVAVSLRDGYDILSVRRSLCQHIGVLDGVHMENISMGIDFVDAGGEWRNELEPREVAEIDRLVSLLH
jgi:hypothetical protein